MDVDKEILDIRKDCYDRHVAIGNDINEIKVMMVEIKGKFENVFGQLENGGDIFAGHEDRIKAIELQLSKWKGLYIGATATAAFFASILSTVLVFTIKLLWEKLSKHI